MNIPQFLNNDFPTTASGLRDFLISTFFRPRTRHTEKLAEALKNGPDAIHSFGGLVEGEARFNEHMHDVEGTLRFRWVKDEEITADQLRTALDEDRIDIMFGLAAAFGLSSGARQGGLDAIQKIETAIDLVNVLDSDRTFDDLTPRQISALRKAAELFHAV